jgi:4-hydroxyphenylacetate 3-monooxygenase
MRVAVTRPLTGSEYLESLRDDRAVYIYGERVKDVTTHPAFRNSARMVARLYDALHDPKYKAKLTAATDTGSGSYTHTFFKFSRSREDLLAGRDAIAEWARLTYGWMGRSPDYKASFLATLGANADFYSPYQANAQTWYKQCQEQVLYLSHAIVNPPVDRHLPPHEVADCYVHVEKETDAGLIVSGAKVVATGSAMTHYTYIYHDASTDKTNQAGGITLAFFIAMDAPGLKLICRNSYEMTAAVMGHPYEFPLSSRLDENDAILIMDQTLIPWENILIYGDTKKSNNDLPDTGFLHRYSLHGCTRLAVKLDFICGLLLKAVDCTGVGNYRGVQVNVGEVIAWRNLFWGLSDGMASNVQPWHNDSVLPNLETAMSYRVIMGDAYSRIKAIIEQVVASGLIYQPSSVLDFKSPEIRPYLDKYVRGSKGVEAVERVKVMKLMWDAIGSEFGSRHELYELNYSGSHETVRLDTFINAHITGLSAQMRALAEQCMAEYDLNGWTVPDLINNDDISFFANRAPVPKSTALAIKAETADDRDDEVHRIRLQLRTLPQNEAENGPRMQLLMNLAQIYWQRMEYPSAISAWRQIAALAQMEKEPVPLALAYTMLSTLYIHSGDSVNAVQCAKRALVYTPQDPNVMLGLANALDFAGEEEEVCQWLQRILAEHPDFFEAHEQLGCIHFRHGAFDLAEQAFRKALELEPTAETAMNELGNLLVFLERFDEALLQYQEAQKVHPTSTTSFGNIGYCYYRWGNLGEAQQWLERRVELDPSDALSASIILGIITRCSTGDAALQASDTHFQRALAIYNSKKALMMGGRLIEHDACRALILTGMGDKEANAAWQFVLDSSDINHVSPGAWADWLYSLRLLAPSPHATSVVNEMLNLLEHHNLLQNAQSKLNQKGLDFLVANDVSASDAGFAVDTNRVTLLAADGTMETLPLLSKAAVAETVVERVCSLLPAPAGAA